MIIEIELPKVKKGKKNNIVFSMLIQFSCADVILNYIIISWLA